MLDQIDVRPVGTRTRRRRQVQRLSRRSALHTVAALIPGAGLLGTRYRRLGWILLGLLALTVVGLALFVVSQGVTAAALTLAVKPDVLLTIAGLAVVGALVWVFSIVLTHRGTAPDRPDGRPAWGLRLLTGLVCLAVVLPAVQVVRYSLIQRDVVSSVFTGTGSSSALKPSAEASATPNVAAPDPWAGVDRVNLLLIGSDAGSDREGTRTDSMVEASIDPQTGSAVLISIPRNLEHAPIPTTNPLHRLYPNGYYCAGVTPGNECLINALWSVAEQNKNLFKNDPSPGLTTIRDVIGDITGLPVDYSTVIDLQGFQSLVDAMGGVTVNVTERLPIEGYHTSSGGVAGIEGYIEPGRQTLDGYHALWYARSRLLSDDFSRMRRQRCLIGGLLDQVNPVTMLRQYPQLAQVAKQNIQTDIPVDALPAWVDLVQRIQKGSITSLTFTDATINPANPNLARMRAMVEAAISAPAASSASSVTAPPTTSPTSTAPPTTSATQAPTTGKSGTKSGTSSKSGTAKATSSSPSPSSPTTTPTVSGGVVDVRTAC